ncbi:unnamed protein product, partial [Mesorhabditis spiculigera]
MIQPAIQQQHPAHPGGHHVFQLPYASTSRTQRLDLHSRISQAVRSTLQHVRVLENTRSRIPGPGSQTLKPFALIIDR